MGCGWTFTIPSWGLYECEGTYVQYMGGECNGRTPNDVAIIVSTLD